MRCLALLFLLSSCSITIPENVSGWDFTTVNSPFSEKKLSRSMSSLVYDWEENVGHSKAELRDAIRGTTVTWWYDASGDQHLPNTTNVHGRYYSDGRIDLAWIQNDEIADTSWRHEWAHLFLFEIEGDLDPNHLECGGPWKPHVQQVVDG